MVIANCLIFPVDLLVRIVESMRSAHLENRHMSAKSGTSVANVYHANAGLTDHQRVGRRRGNTLCNVRLKIDDTRMSEVDDTRMSEVDVVTPTCHNWVRFHASVIVFFKV